MTTSASRARERAVVLTDTVGGSGTLRWSDFEGNRFPFTADGAPRKDVTCSLRLFAQIRAYTLEGFGPQVSVVEEQRSSNAQLH